MASLLQAEWWGLRKEPALGSNAGGKVSCEVSAMARGSCPRPVPRGPCNMTLVNALLSLPQFPHPGASPGASTV